jgi:alpha-L-arabinofuranosidase
MISRSYQPLHVGVEVAGGAGMLKASAARSADGKTLVLRVVNAGDREIITRLELMGFRPAQAEAPVEELAGALDAVNTATQPRRIVPVTRRWRHGDGMSRTFPPRSFTVLTLQ